MYPRNVRSEHTHIARCSLPPSEEGEWWELTDDSRGGIPYYYQTKTGETVWERPDAFVIPLGILQASCRSLPFVSIPNLTRITHRTPHLLADSLHGTAQAPRVMATFHLHKNEKTANTIDCRPRANGLQAERRVHAFPLAMVPPSHATKRDARNRPHRAQEAGLPLPMVPLSPRRLGMWSAGHFPVISMEVSAST